MNGAITINAGYPWQAGISGNLNYRVGDLNFFTTSGYRYREVPGNSLNETRFFGEDEVISLDDTFLVEDRDFDRIRKGINTNVGVEWYINKTSSVTASYLYRSGDNESNTTNIITEPDLNGTIISQNIRFDPEIEDDQTKQYAITLARTLMIAVIKLTADFQIENSTETENSRITQDNSTRIELVNTDEAQERILLQADYVLPIGKNSQFELGYRGNFNELNTEFLVQNDDNGLVVTDTDLSNNLIFTERINAAYSQYGSK